MANELDELTGPTAEEGRDINVIQKQIEVKVGGGSTAFQIILWCLGIIPGLVFLIMKMGAENYLRSLQQKIQADASTIDNYLIQRGEILKNETKLLATSIDLDKEVMEKVSAYRGGINPNSDEARNEMATQMDGINAQIRVALENYPDLQSQSTIVKAMQDNDYLQREITAAREKYNDDVLAWNADIQAWPTKMIVAAKHHYTTRIPFAASKAEKAAGRGTFF